MLKYLKIGSLAAVILFFTVVGLTHVITIIDEHYKFTAQVAPLVEPPVVVVPKPVNFVCENVINHDITAKIKVFEIVVENGTVFVQTPAGQHSYIKSQFERCFTIPYEEETK